MEPEHSSCLLEPRAEPAGSSCRAERGCVPTPATWARLNGAGAWPSGRPLPLPRWGALPRPPLAVATVEQYEELASAAELAAQQLLQAHHYNSVGNLLRFYEEFRASGQTSLAHFYRQYSPPITAEHYTCVGLALELLRRLTQLELRFPGISLRLFLVSCEESVEDMDEYMNGDPQPLRTEKEHVMVAMHLVVSGRPGIMLLDPGYHVARVITVMQDNLYPHTGWFVQSDEPHCRKEYNYSLSGGHRYVVWSDRETRNGLEKTSHALVYVARPFLCPIDVTERRNLVYNFRSLLGRDTKGHLVAGFYFKISTAEPPVFTIFHQQTNGVKRTKTAFKQLLSPELDGSLYETIEACNQQLGLWAGQLMSTLGNLAVVLADTEFVTQLLGINTLINEMCD